jgi:uncharacterized protein
MTAAAIAPELRLVPHRGHRTEWRDAGGGHYDLTGHAAVFNQPSHDLGGFREIIEPGFFRAALRKTPDVRLLVNHDPTLVLARTASGTLRLREDDVGLQVGADVAPTTYATDLRTAMQRGDVDQMSFAFSLADGGDDWAIAEDGTVVRTLRAEGADELFDVSVVTYPAYEDSEASIRALATRYASPEAILLRARELGRLTGPAVDALGQLQRRTRQTAALQQATHARASAGT